MYRLKSRKFWLVTFAAGAGVVAALFLPAIPCFEWLREHTAALYGAAAGLVSVYIGGNVATDWVNRGKEDGAIGNDCS